MIIAGQGTVALEMLAEQPDLEVLIISIGGGGLIAGSAIAAKSTNPNIHIVGVQTERFPSMYNAVQEKQLAYGETTIAEGIAVKQPGELTLPIIKQQVDDIVLVDESSIEHAVLLLLEVEKTVAEGAGAAGLAALIDNRNHFAGRKVGLIVSGGNIDLPVLAAIIQRGLVQSHRLTRLRVDIRDVPGSLARVTACVEETAANIAHVHHHRTFIDQPLQMVEVEFVLQTRGEEHVREILDLLNQSGFKSRLVN